MKKKKEEKKKGEENQLTTMLKKKFLRINRYTKCPADILLWYVSVWCLCVGEGGGKGRGGNYLNEGSKTPITPWTENGMSGTPVSVPAHEDPQQRQKRN